VRARPHRARRHPGRARPRRGDRRDQRLGRLADRGRPAYLVTPGLCNCVDRQRHPVQSCKHVWAVDIVRVAEERQRRLDARASEQARRAAVTADQVALAYAKSIGFGRAA